MKIGLALGSGSSRGWAHIGIINALVEIGIEPDIICGTSIGSLVGASYLSNKLGKLEKWVSSLTKFKIASFFEINASFNGFVNIEKMHNFLNKYVANSALLIESFDKSYAAIATDLKTGKEVWFTKGSVIEAVWASISLPGLFPIIKNNNMWLVDGGLVNPVPVSVCRALGADIVIAVNLNGDIVGKHFKKAKHSAKQEIGVISKINDLVKDYTKSPKNKTLDFQLFSSHQSKDKPPSLFEAIASSINITQDRITRSRIAITPPDILLSPKLSHIKLLEFYRAKEAIIEGAKCVQNVKSELIQLIDSVKSK